MVKIKQDNFFFMCIIQSIATIWIIYELEFLP